jgi:hypothetical protein
MKQFLMGGIIIISCNQQMYDAIYGAIIKMTLDAPNIQEAINYKNDVIENLRKLCNNQRSSYETH